MKSVFTVAAKEFSDGLRNRWLLSITIIFALLSVGLTYFGSAVAGETGLTSTSTTVASLASLAVFLIPLIALLLSYDSFVGELESGTLLLLLTYPINKTQLLMGKFIGQGSIIALAILIGFGASGVILYAHTQQTEIITVFSLFIASAVMLGLSFIAIAFIISISVSEKSKAAGAALIVWFIFALIFDLGLLALLVGTEDGISQQSLTFMMMLNPADIFRLVNLAGLDSADVNGALAIAIRSSLSLTQLLCMLVVWVILPLILAITLFTKKRM